jgi:transposase
VGVWCHFGNYRSFNQVDMVVTGTREAFIALINERGIYKRLGVSISTVSTWKIYLRSGKSISLDKMEEMLLKAGASVVQEKVWEVK